MLLWLYQRICSSYILILQITTSTLTQISVIRDLYRIRLKAAAENILSLMTSNLPTVPSTIIKFMKAASPSKGTANIPAISDLYYNQQSTSTKAHPEVLGSEKFSELSISEYFRRLIQNAGINFHQTQTGHYFNQILVRFLGVGLFYIYYSTFIMYIDACLTDDEPIWEPIEWSLVQTWILFLFTFAWIAENLIVSRYGSYTGRDKRVWFAWYKTFWLMELYYIINFGAAIIFVIVPFYYELNYNLSYVVSWWHWYTRLFFFKFISVYSIILMYGIILQFSVRWLFWKKSLIHIIIINIFIGYLLYTHFIMAFFGYFTNPTWYQQSRPIDYIQLSHEPSRWGWGTAKKDHFTYHNVKTVFWFKNDGPYASAFLLSHLYIFLSLFFLYIYWITLFRRVYSMSEVPLTFTTYCVSSLKQFFYLFLCIYLFILFSYTSHYLRYPVEYSSTLNTPNWFTNFLVILRDYYTLFI